MATGGFLQTFEAHLGIMCNSLPMLVPLYSYWRYRKFYGEGEDEYVSRLGGGVGAAGESAQQQQQRRVFVHMANGLPLELDELYGQRSFFMTRVERGESMTDDVNNTHRRTPSKGTLRLGRKGTMDSFFDDDLGDSESTRRLQAQSGPSVGITIETRWTIETEDTVRYAFGRRDT